MCGIWKQRVQGAYTMKLLPSVIVCGFARAALACSDLSSAQHAAIPQYIQAAIVNPARQEKDRQRDANQKPGEVLTLCRREARLPGGRFLARATVLNRVC